jgi:hypothetical protein
MSPAERSIVERTTFPLGEEFRIGDVLLRCVERPYISCPQDACRGCYFSENYRTCPPSQCSSFGRTDRKNVWFVEVNDHEDSENCK